MIASNAPDENTRLLINQPNETTTTTTESPKPTTAFEALIRFLLLPSQIYMIILLEFLNTFRSYGLRIIIFNYITNEFAITDSETGRILGLKSLIDICVGLVGCILVDFWGVRRVSLVALSVATVARALMAFGRSKQILYVVMFACSPLGDALLSIGLYRVALKKLTTPMTRPLAFAVSYAVQNFAGVCVAFLVDWMRSGDDIRVDVKVFGIGGVFTPVRQFVALTWLVLLFTLALAFAFLEDMTVIDPNDPNNDMKFDAATESSKKDKEQQYIVPLEDSQCSLVQDAKPMFEPQVIQRWFRQHQHTIREVHNGCKYKTFHTIHAKTSITSLSPIQRIVEFIQQLASVLQLRDSWRVIVFSFASVAVSLQWTASDISLPPFLERRFGEDVHIYTIQNIHMMGCMILPPIVGALTTGRGDFDIIMPGLWIMAISPIMLVLSPTIAGACAWQVVLTIGQVLWSPRQDSWVASLAPTGMEGLFFAVSCTRALFVPLGDFSTGWLNSKYNPNCLDCRDSYGHFCDIPVVEQGVTICSSSQELCQMHLSNNQMTCPSTCNDCPTWEYTDPSSLWFILMSISLISPVLVRLCLPFLKDEP